MGNSVIYRPAYDAEVEYLESDVNSYIDTGLKASSELGILAHIRFSSTKQWLFGGANGLVDREFGFLIDSTTLTSYRYGTHTVNLDGLSLNTTYEFDSTQNHNVMKVGSLTYTATATTFTSDYNFYLFTENRNGTPNNASGGVRIYDFKIYQNSTLARDFIPVRIGSVGYLYDKVTKQLFANKGTGNFVLGNDVSNAVIPQQRCVLYFGNQRSVVYERIYDEYEWLKCNDGVINLPSNSESFSFFVDLTKSDSNVIILKSEPRYTYHYKSDNRIYYMTCWDRNQSRDVIISQTLSNPINIISTTSSFKVNNISFTKFGFPPKYISASHALAGEHHILKLSEISIDGSIRYIPCRLLRPIPAILDGNGIARQAGECGMWDKVSNRFYGNVANSGTFTVKGPKCYEEYKWLKVSVSTKAAMAALPVDSTNLYFKHKHISGINYHYFRATGDGVDYDYFYESDVSRCAIWDLSTMTLVYRTQDIIEDEIVINCNSSNRYVNGYDIPIYGSTIKQVSIISRNQNGFEGLTSSITVDGSVRYVPCKLTHGIPASMDANGITRPAGTCGMWDKVNDKFYGNVANSGTFTVSND